MEKIVLSKTEPQKWGDVLKKLRKDNRLDQHELAEEIETYPSYISRIECGKMGATAEILAGCARVFNVEFSIE